MDEKAVEAEVLDGLTGRADKAIARIIAETVDKSKEIEEVARILAERTGISMEQAEGVILNAMKWRACAFEEIITALNLLAGCQVQVKISVKSIIRTEREKWRAAERATAHRFHQYKGRENTWGAKKRKGRRQREWRGQRKDN